MKTLEFDKTNYVLSQLHDELFERIPALRPTGGVPRISVRSSGTKVWLDVPDDTDIAAIKAVVDAHVPRAPVPPPDFAAMRANIKAQTTATGIRDAIVAYLEAKG